MDNVFMLCLLLLRYRELFYYKIELRMFYRIFIICK